MWSVFFVFLSYLDRNFVKGDFLSLALDAEKESKEMFFMLNGTFCAKMSTVRESFLYQVSDGAEAVRSVVSPAGKLVHCSITVNHMQVKSFMHECRLGLKEQRGARQPETRVARMDEAKRMCREFKERTERRVSGDAGQDSALQEKVVHRAKRGFTYPGTLWCGAGNMADSYDQLGDFADTDACCRIHDHCPHVIHAFSSKYGYTNFKWHSICHCDCDNTLRECLRKVNDTSSRVVGQAFFNVIGVPCFELAYEEQCAERHWYGMCKRYEKFPIAVLNEAVPYDFGGIEVIDQLTLAPPKRPASKKNGEEEKPESPTQSTISGPEEPSLTNVVTAAEDFIKVLATVSTSQSSTNDSDKGETQSSEKKKKKNSGKKKKKVTKKQKGKGKGRKRKQKTEAGAKKEDGGAVQTTGKKAEQVVDLSNFITELHRHNQSSGNTNSVGDSEYELGGKDGPFNEVMKDEPAMNKEPSSITSPPAAQKKPKSDMMTKSKDEISLSTSTTMTSVIPHKAKTRRLRKGKGKKRKITSSPPSELMNTADDLKAIPVPTVFTITPLAQTEKSLVGVTEGQPVISASTVIPNVQRNRSKDRGDRKKKRKVSPAPPSVAVTHGNSSEDNLKVIPLPGPSLPNTEGQLSGRLDTHQGETNARVAPLNSSFSVRERQMSKKRGLRNRRRKTHSPPTTENPLFHNIYQNALSEMSDAPNNPATTAAISRLTEETVTPNEWRRFTTVTAAPVVVTQRNRQIIRQQRKPRQKLAPSALSGPNRTEQIPMTLTTASTEELKPRVTTSATPVMSPMQLSMERVRAQFIRKKRRKAALTARRHLTVLY